MVKKNNKQPKVHPDLEGLDFTIDSYGKIHSTIDREKIHEFLNREMVNDKKLPNSKDENNEGRSH